LKRALFSSAAFIAVPCGWLASASAIYCAGSGKMALFRFPFAQWAVAAPWWRYSWDVTLWVGLGAAVPTAVLLLCGFGMGRHWWLNRKSARPVYGKTEWATRQQMDKGGIVSRDRPF
jgi:hypothetical protein